MDIVVSKKHNWSLPTSTVNFKFGWYEFRQRLIRLGVTIWAFLLVPCVSLFGI